MVIPDSYLAALLLSILSMVCWGSWANTFKLTGPKWRFELFYFDFAFGLLLVATIAAFTLGMAGTDLSFVDNMMVTGKRQIAFAVAAGCVFNLANMLLVGAISIAGMAVAFPVGIGLALVVGVVLNYLLRPQANALLLFGGVLLVLVAIVLDALAYSSHFRSTQTGAKKKSATKGIVISLVSGVLMGTFYPIVELSRGGDIGLGPYSIAFCFGVGVFLSTFVLNIYFMNLPIQGQAVEFRYYFKGTLSMHLLGVAGGGIWCIGALSNFLASSVPPNVQVGPAVSYALGQGATLVSALWGLLVWKEFQGATGSVKNLLGLMIVAFVAGLGMISIAPLFAK